VSSDLWWSVWSVVAAALVVVVLFGALWTWGNRGGRISLVDVGWGAGFPLIAVAGFLVSGAGDPDRLTHVLLLVLPVLWGVRLAVHNGRRLARHDTEDPRYQQLLDDAGSSRARTTLTSVVAPQAGFMLVVALPIVLGQNNHEHWLPLSLVGVLLWAIGVFFETVGDWQLERFKAQPDSGDRVLDRGLWRYTRHPNYFGDVCAWWGTWLVAAHSWAGFAAVVGPVLMTYTIVAKTGSALTEKDMAESKPGFEEYVERTSAFFPLPPTRSEEHSRA
jgi:steroid 5-alpha reductase family enzyme